MPSLLRQIASGGIDPALDVVIPGVGGVAHGWCLFRVAGEFGDVRCRPAARKFLPPG